MKKTRKIISVVLAVIILAGTRWIPKVKKLHPVYFILFSCKIKASSFFLKNRYTEMNFVKEEFVCEKEDIVGYLL